MRLERLFVEKVADLRSRVEPPISEYDQVMAAGIIYELLLDKLYDKARRSATGPPLRFHVNRPEGIGPLPDKLPMPAWRWGVGGVLDPGLAGTEGVTVNVDAFLRIPVMQVEVDYFTIRDIVQVVANSLGGRHYGMPRKEALRPLLSEPQIAEFALITPAEGTWLSTSIVILGHAVLRACYPMERLLR